MSNRFPERQPSLEVVTYGFQIRNALRRAEVFLLVKGPDRAVGLLLPAGGDVDVYVKAAKHYLEHNEILKHYSVTSVFAGRRSSSSFSEEAQSVLSGKTAVVVLVEDGAAIPPEVSVALDKMVEVGPILPKHVSDAVQHLWQTKISLDEARPLCAYPANLLFGALRKGRPISLVLEKLASRPTQPAPVEWEPRVEELEGYGKAKDWALDLIEDLREWRERKVAWQDVSSALLLSGPPGTGKTLFARAVANSCGASFFASSAAQWQSMGHLGDMLKAMRKSFREAAREAPSVLLVDEADSFGDRAKFSENHVDYSTQVVNALLELLDGAQGREGVVVIACTNQPERMDPALRRPGRLDRHVVIELPDRGARSAILKMHLGDVELSSDDIEAIAVATEGCSGALLRQYATTARRTARRERRPVVASDLIEVVPEIQRLDKSELRAISVHEAGHAVVGHELAIGEVLHVIAKTKGGERSNCHGCVEWRRKKLQLRERQSYLDEIAMLLGGVAAEKIILNQRYDGAGGSQGSDLQRAAELATYMIATLGMGDTLSYADISSVDGLGKLRREDPLLRRRVERLLEVEFARACDIVVRHRANVERVAGELVRREVLSGDEFRTLIGSWGLPDM